MTGVRTTGPRPLYLYGLGSERETYDRVIVTVILILLLRYSLRIVALARAYPELPAAGPDEPRGPRPEGIGMAPKPGILELATRYFRPHAWIYGIAMLLASMLALGSVAGWVFWPLMVWTILFLLYFLVVKSLDVDSGRVAERTEKTAMKAFDISHIETIRESYEKSASRLEGEDPGESEDAG